MSNADIEIADVLGLPERARQTHRLTKKDMIEQWEHTAPAGARLLSRVVASGAIVGVLTPATIGVAAVRDAERPVDMIPVVAVRLVDGVKTGDVTRVAELLHRAMPRPAVLGLISSQRPLVLSLALTRLSRTEEGMSVIEEHLLEPVGDLVPGSLHVAQLDHSDLAALYRDLVRIAAADGKPAPGLGSAAEAVALRRQVLSLEDDLATVRRSAAREKAIPRKIEFNTQARVLREKIAQKRAELFRSEPDTSHMNEDPKVAP